VPQPLPHLYRELERLKDAAAARTDLLETGEPPPEANGSKPLRSSADGHRDDRRRGLPMIGGGVLGATDETHPVRALLAKEGRRSR
jgi:hypothetical protein